MNYNKSDYLKSIMEPFNHVAGIPDMDMTTAAPKSVKVSDTLAVAGSGSCLFVYLPHNLQQPVRLYVFVAAQNRYVFQRIIPYDDTIANDFTYGRFISGGLKIKSATTSGTIFNIAGTINATAFQEIPSIEDELTFTSITTYNRNSIDVIPNGTVSNGVVAIAFPDGDQAFGLFETGNAFNVKAHLDVTSYAGVNPGWSIVLPFIYDSDNDPGFIPGNCWDNREIDFSLSLTFPQNLLIPSFNPHIILTTYYEQVALDWVTVNNITAQSAFYEQYVPAAGPTTVTFYGNRKDYDGRTLRRITLELVNGGELPTALVRGELNLVLPTYYNTGQRGPGHLIALQGMSASQQISVSGAANFEAVPNATLSKNVKTKQFQSFNPVEMEMVTRYLSESEFNNIKQLYIESDYNSIVVNGFLEKHYDLDRLATATGWDDFLARVLKMGKPLLKMAAPLVGTALAGPTGGALAGATVNALLGDSATYKYGRSAMLGGADFEGHLAALTNGMEYGLEDISGLQVATGLAQEIEAATAVNSWAMSKSSSSINLANTLNTFPIVSAKTGTAVPGFTFSSMHLYEGFTLYYVYLGATKYFFALAGADTGVIIRSCYAALVTAFSILGKELSEKVNKKIIYHITGTEDFTGYSSQLSMLMTILTNRSTYPLTGALLIGEAKDYHPLDNKLWPYMPAELDVKKAMTGTLAFTLEYKIDDDPTPFLGSEGDLESKMGKTSDVLYITELASLTAAGWALSSKSLNRILKPVTAIQVTPVSVRDLPPPMEWKDPAPIKAGPVSVGKSLYEMARAVPEESWAGENPMMVVTSTGEEIPVKAISDFFESGYLALDPIVQNKLASTIQNAQASILQAAVDFSTQRYMQFYNKLRSLGALMRNMQGTRAAPKKRFREVEDIDEKRWDNYSYKGYSLQQIVAYFDPVVLQKLPRNVQMTMKTTIDAGMNAVEVLQNKIYDPLGWNQWEKNFNKAVNAMTSVEQTMDSQRRKIENLKRQNIGRKLVPEKKTFQPGKKEMGPKVSVVSGLDPEEIAYFQDLS